MLRLIENLPANVLGVEAAGTVTHEDYQAVLIPAAEAMMAQGPINMLYVLGDAFQTYEARAIWDDGRFGVKHWRDFKRIAVVGDRSWLRVAVGVFKPFVPCDVRLFSLSDLAAAKAWISNGRDPRG